MILRLFFYNCGSILARQMQYRFNFILGLVVTLGIAFAEPIIQLFFYKGVHGYQGWDVHQIAVFQGMMLIWFGIKDSLFGGVRSGFQTMIRDGSFDRMLFKPYSPLVLIFTSGFNFWGLASLTAGVGVLGYIIYLNGIQLGIQDVLTCGLFMVGGLIFYCALLIIYCGVIIHLLIVNQLEELMDKLMRLGEYPLNLFPGSYQWLLTLLLPMTLWVYFPAQTILHRLDGSSYYSILVSIVLFLVSIKFFNLSLKKYSSAGG